MLETLFKNFELTALIFSFVEYDACLSSTICLNKSCEYEISNNSTLWSMITHRVSCLICVLEAKSSMSCYVTDKDNANVLNTYWKDIAKEKISKKRILRQWKVFGASRIMVRASHLPNDVSCIGGCKVCPMNHRDKCTPRNYVFHTKDRKSQSAASKKISPLNSNNLMKVYQKLKKIMGYTLYQSKRLDFESRQPSSRYSAIVKELDDRLPPPPNNMSLSSVHKLLDAFLDLDANVLLSDSPLTHHTHELSTIPTAWIDVAKTCALCHMNTVPITARNQYNRTKIWKEVVINPTRGVCLKDSNDVQAFSNATESVSPGQKAETKACLDDMFCSVGGTSSLLCPGKVRWFVTNCSLPNEDVRLLAPREILVAVSFSGNGDGARVCGVTSSKGGFRWLQ